MLVRAPETLVSSVNFNFCPSSNFLLQAVDSLSNTTDYGRCEESFRQDLRKQTADVMSVAILCTQMFLTSLHGLEIQLEELRSIFHIKPRQNQLLFRRKLPPRCSPQLQRLADILRSANIIKTLGSRNLTKH